MFTLGLESLPAQLSVKWAGHSALCSEYGRWPNDAESSNE